MITTILFDLGNVLLPLELELTQQKFAKIGLTQPTEEFHNWVKLQEVGEIQEEEFIHNILGKAPVGTTYQQVLEAWNSILGTFPDSSLALLQKLSQSYRLELLSNTNAIHIANFKAKMGDERYQQFAEYFDAIYYSHEIQKRKPNTETFQWVLDQSQSSADEYLFIDDTLENIEAANTLGIHTWHLTDMNDLTVERLEEKVQTL